MTGSRIPQKLACLAIYLVGALLCLNTTAWAGDPPLPKGFWYQGRLLAAVSPQADEGYIQITQRVMENPVEYKRIIEFNGNRPVRLGRNIRFPIDDLKPQLRGEVLRAMYPEDELTEKGWAHTVNDPLETFMQLTLAYTGSRGKYKALAARNGIRNANRLQLGQQIVIPLEWIPEELGFRPQAVKGPLKITKDNAGRMFALYTVKPNDTLYSLVLRFTDRERAEEVNRMARLLVRLNALRSESTVPVGLPIRIPVEWISEDYLVSHKPKEIVPQPKPKKSVPRGGSLHVIIDPGHGGVDPGAVYGDRRRADFMVEHEVVYDISLRLASILNSNGVRVHMTVDDKEQPLPVTRVSAKRLGQERIQVDPPYRISNARVGVNMRVYLINALYRKLRARGVAAENILLISVHGDALAKTLRGAMIYFPDHRLRTNEFYPKGRVYRLRKEAVPNRLLFSRASAKEAHWDSKAFADNLLVGLKEGRVRVGGRRPVRSYYYRNGERTLPAVLRYSKVPASVLVEVANLNNTEDRNDLQRGASRQNIAAGLAKGVLRHAKRPAGVAMRAKAG